ncbi:MAG: DUF882 domain-containing protein [Devosiaceae bacterium]|nr:DUF882 domain-containing protein [Devosiaceae bacterium]
MAFITILLAAVSPANASRDTRSLYIYYSSTKETAKITFKRNGRYDKKGLTQLNQLLRDWRRNEPTNMDPTLFDLVWEVYKESGATGPIHVVSAYRSPATNEMLRSRSRAVARSSRHTRGQALDFFIPGVSTKKLREIALKKQVGGVGYYPTANSPFVHLDTGNVRAWPRLTRTQLARIFPDGRTLHIPNTGVPLSNAGYKLAQADWNKCRQVPCSGRTTTRIASNNQNSQTSDKPSRTLFDLFFGGDEDEGNINNNVAIAANNPTQRQVTTRPVSSRAPKSAPIPMTRPIQNNVLLASTNSVALASAPAPAPRPDFLVSTQTQQNPNDNFAIAAIDENSSPAPRVLLTRQANNSLLTAFAPEVSSSISTSSLVNENSKTANDEIVTASISPDIRSNQLSGLIESTWDIVTLTQSPPKKIIEVQNYPQRQISLIAPDLEHVAQTFTDPRSITSSRYAFIYEPDEADFNPDLELGSYWNKVGFLQNNTNNMNIFRFKTGAKLIVASR